MNPKDKKLWDALLEGDWDAPQSELDYDTLQEAKKIARKAKAAYEKNTVSVDKLVYGINLKTCLSVGDLLDLKAGQKVQLIRYKERSYYEKDGFDIQVVEVAADGIDQNRRVLLKVPPEHPFYISGISFYDIALYGELRENGWLLRYA